MTLPMILPMILPITLPITSLITLPMTSPMTSCDIIRGIMSGEEISLAGNVLEVTHMFFPLL